MTGCCHPLHNCIHTYAGVSYNLPCKYVLHTETGSKIKVAFNVFKDEDYFIYKTLL